VPLTRYFEEAAPYGPCSFINAVFWQVGHSNRRTRLEVCGSRIAVTNAMGFRQATQSGRLPTPFESGAFFSMSRMYSKLGHPAALFRSFLGRQLRNRKSCFGAQHVKRHGH
jgi:hypothetical protein